MAIQVHAVGREQLDGAKNIAVDLESVADGRRCADPQCSLGGAVIACIGDRGEDRLGAWEAGCLAAAIIGQSDIERLRRS